MNALDEWLTAVNARFLWQISHPTSFASVTMYRIGAATAIVIKYEAGGWDIYTPHESNDIAASLRDAELRLGAFAPRIGNLADVFGKAGE